MFRNSARRVPRRLPAHDIRPRVRGANGSFSCDGTDAIIVSDCAFDDVTTGRALASRPRAARFSLITDVSNAITPRTRGPATLPIVPRRVVSAGFRAEKLPFTVHVR